MKYIPQLTFLRFIAAILVVVFHYAPQSLFPSAYSAPLAISAVNFFFFLSGTVLSFNYFDSSKIEFKKFVLKRLARIYPVYLLALILTLVFGMLFNNSYPRGLSIILQIFGVQAWVPGFSSGLNYPGWTISVEFFFYGTFPFIIPLLSRLSRIK